MIEIIIIVALFSAFVLSLARKWGWIEWAQVHAPNDFIYRLLSCQFCLSWWVCLLLSVVLVWSWVAIPMAACSTMLCLKLW